MCNLVYSSGCIQGKWVVKVEVRAGLGKGALWTLSEAHIPEAGLSFPLVARNLTTLNVTV